MSSEVFVALLALAGTVIGSFAGILVANKLVNFRIEQLEKRVKEHNCFDRRVQSCEDNLKVVNAELNIAWQ